MKGTDFSSASWSLPHDRQGQLTLEMLFSAPALLIISFLVLLPLVPLDYVKLYSIPLAILFAWEFFRLRFWVLPKNPAVVIFLFSEVYALAFHLLNPGSVENILATTAAFSGVYLVLRKTADRIGFDALEWRVFYLLAVVSLALFPLSTFLTAVHYPTAPSTFFWQADPSGGDRLKLMAGGNGSTLTFGHSDVIWSLGFALLLNEKFRRRANVFSRRWLGHLILLVAGSLVLVLTGARISLLILMEVFLLFLAYRHLLNVKLFAVINVVLSVFFLWISLSPLLTAGIGYIVERAQHAIPQVRLSGGTNGVQHSSVLSGRDVLNQTLAWEAAIHPAIGLGHDAPVLQYGVTPNGDISGSTNTYFADTESGLRLAVAYGYPYFGLQVLFMLWPLLLAVTNRAKDPKLSCAISGVVTLTFVSEGGFGNWYSVSFLLGIMTVLYCLKDSSGWDASFDPAFCGFPMASAGNSMRHGGEASVAEPTWH